MDWLALWGNSSVLAAAGALVSALRVAANSPDKTLREKVWNVAVSVLLAVGLAEYATPAGAPRLSLVVGLVAGGVCDSLLDAVRALSPRAAGGLVDALLAKFGYAKTPPDEPPDV